MKLEFRNIRLRTGDFALDLNTKLEGEAIAIFGRNGAGKTTLLDLIAGLRTPDSGAVCVNGKVWSDTSTKSWLPPQQRAIGYVPQEAALFPHLSVRRNITYGGHRSQHTQSATSYSVSHLAEILEISALMQSRADSISGGERQRVALARALASQPSLLLLDEPLSSLDGGIKARGLELLTRIRSEFKIPMIYVSHSPDEILALCDRLLVVEQGKLLRTGQPSEVFKPRKADIYEVD